MPFIQAAELVQQIIYSVLGALQIFQKAPFMPNIKFKQLDDPVTQIDHTIQKYLVGHIEEKFPGIKIVGEEVLDYELIDENLLTVGIQKNVLSEFEFIGQTDQKYLIEDLCLFIDPLDGTRGLICGKKWECTILVGVTYRGKPIIGVIGQPFKQISEFNYQFSPSITFGGSFLEEKCAIECKIKKEKLILRKFYLEGQNIQGVKKAAISSRRKNQQSEYVIKELKLKNIFCGGSGNKFLKLIRREVDFVMFLNSPTSTWDSCAGEAIVLGMGGFFFKPNLEQISYRYENQSQLNKQGFIACLSKKLADETLQIFSHFV